MPPHGSLMFGSPCRAYLYGGRSRNSAWMTMGNHDDNIIQLADMSSQCSRSHRRIILLAVMIPSPCSVDVIIVDNRGSFQARLETGVVRYPALPFNLGSHLARDQC